MHAIASPVISWNRFDPKSMLIFWIGSHENHYEGSGFSRSATETADSWDRSLFNSRKPRRLGVGRSRRLPNGFVARSGQRDRGRRVSSYQPHGSLGIVDAKRRAFHPV